MQKPFRTEPVSSWSKMCCASCREVSPAVPGQGRELGFATECREGRIREDQVLRLRKAGAAVVPPFQEGLQLACMHVLMCCQAHDSALQGQVQGVEVLQACRLIVLLQFCCSVKLLDEPVAKCGCPSCCSLKGKWLLFFPPAQPVGCSVHAHRAWHIGMCMPWPCNKLVRTPGEGCCLLQRDSAS